MDPRALILASMAGLAGAGLVRHRPGRSSGPASRGSRAVVSALPVVSTLHAQDTRPCQDDDPVPGVDTGDLAWVGRISRSRPGGVQFATIDLVEIRRPVRWARIVAWESGEIAEGRCADLLEQLRGREALDRGTHVWSVMNSYLDPRLENLGLGRDGYLALLVFLVADGGSTSGWRRVLFSNDGCGGAGSSEAALRVWNGLCRDFPHARDDRRHHERVVIAADHAHPLLQSRIEAYWKNKGRLPGGAANLGSRQVLPVAFSTAAEARDAALAARDAVTATPAFREWFTGSEVVDAEGRPQVCYHGTSTRNPVDFTTFSGDYAPDRGGLLAFFAVESSFAEGYAGRGQTFRPRIYPVYLSIQDPFDFRKHWRLARTFYRETGGIQDDHEARRILMGQREDDGSVPTIAKQILDIEDRRFSSNDLTEAMFTRSVRQGSWDALEAPEFVEWLRKGGHDGIVLMEGGSVNYGIFEPTQVKSATGNVGTFDLDESSISANWRDTTRLRAERAHQIGSTNQTDIESYWDDGEMKSFAYLRDDHDSYADIHVLSPDMLKERLDHDYGDIGQGKIRGKRDVAFLSGIEVNEKMRGRRLGRELLAACLRELPASIKTCWVASTPEARGFYETMGFDEVGWSTYLTLARLDRGNSKVWP